MGQRMLSIDGKTDGAKHRAILEENLSSKRLQTVAEVNIPGDREKNTHQCNCVAQGIINHWNDIFRVLTKSYWKSLGRPENKGSHNALFTIWGILKIQSSNVQSCKRDIPKVGDSVIVNGSEY